MSLNLLSNEKNTFLDVLDWELITNQLVKYSYFEETINGIKSPLSHKKLGAINFEYDNLEKFLDNVELYQNILICEFEKLTPSLEYNQTILSLNKGKILNLEELNFSCILLEIFENLKKTFKDFSIINHLYPEDKAFFKIRSKFTTPFRTLIKVNGDINYEGHPELKKCKSELTLLEKHLRDDISIIAKNSLYKNALQFSEFDIVGDHYVLAVKSDSYMNEHGPIIEKSNSGMTLFVEPYELRAKCDKRIRLLAKIEEILSKICLNFSQVLHPYHFELKNILEAVHQIDLLNTKAQYCNQHDLTRPILTEEYHVELHDFFHPLISNPIRNTIITKKAHSGLVISGPNTGGKTVTLKSIAICHLFLHMGLFVPATKAILSPVTNIYFLGNEGQDIKEGLSSFALESKNYLNMIKDLGDKNLIIIDEIFNSTSSDEASALAISLFKEILEKSQTKFFISTHHQFLKTTIHSDQNFISSHVGFDLENALPTYKLYTDGPGSSLAFTIFENLSHQYNIENNISKRANSILDSKQVSYDKLLQDLSQKRSKLDHILQENRELNFDLKNQKKSMEGILFLEKQSKHELYQKKLDKIINQAENFYRELKEGKEVSKKKFYNQKSELLQGLKSKKESKQEENKSIPSGLKPIILEAIKIGDNVYSKALNKEVLIEKINLKNKQVHIRAGIVGMWVESNSLYIHHSLLPIIKNVQISVHKERSSQVEYDCRGMRLDEFEKIAFNSIQDLLCKNVPYILLIHGHGSGVLKNWLRVTLKKNYPEISFEAPNGNDGCTEMKLSKE